MYIIIDIGGTKTRIAGTNDLENIGDPIILDTLQDYGKGLQSIKDGITKISNGAAIQSIMMDITGVISDDGKTPITAPHLSDWRNRPLAHELESVFNAKASLVNDTAMVGLGEAVYGAGKGAKNVAYITVSTGVGGVRIVDGNLSLDDRYEPGGQYLMINDPARTMEDLISGRSIQEKYGVHPKEIEKDSPVWEELAQHCAYGVHNTILHWSPDRVVLGGSMFNEIGIKVERVHAHVKKIMKKFPEVPEIVHSSLGDLGGLWGGLAILK
jgi:glucokinase